MALYRGACFVLGVAGIFTAAGAAAQSRAQPAARARRRPPLVVGPACDVGDNPTKLNARSFLLAEAGTIVNFGSQISFDPPYWELRCAAARDDTGRFTFDLRGGGANMSFEFESEHGQLTHLEPLHHNQFIAGGLFLKFVRAIMFPERKEGDQGNHWVRDAFEEGCPAFSKLGPTDFIDPKKIPEDTASCLHNVLTFLQGKTQYPDASRLALHNKYIANLPMQLVFVTPEEAAGKQTRDYARDFLSLNSDDYSNPDNPGHTMLLPAGTKFTPVLDTAQSALPRASGSTSAADGRAIIDHAVKGAISQNLPVPYSRAARSGNTAILVQIDDGRFAMVMGGALLNTEMAEPYKYEKPPVDRSPQDRMFRGTMGEFAAAFPRYMERAASSAGLDPKSYAKAAEYVIDVVKRCDGITPEMAQSATKSPIPRVEMEDVRNLGTEYIPCSQPVGTVPGELTRGLQRGVTLGIAPLGAQDARHRWRDRKAIHVEVLFTAVPGDPRVRGAIGLEPLFANYGIVAATIDEGR